MTIPLKREPTRRALMRFIRDSFFPELRSQRAGQQGGLSEGRGCWRERGGGDRTNASGRSGQSPAAIRSLCQNADLGSDSLE